MADYPVTVNLADYRWIQNASVFAGRDVGRRVRENLYLDKHDADGRDIVVHIPEDTFTVTSSYFGGLFGPSIRKLGPKLFLARYTFTGWDATAVVRYGVREEWERACYLHRRRDA